MRLPTLFVAAIVAGCATAPAGDLITEAKVRSIKIDVTTMDDMVRDFGPPRSRHVNAQGLQTATWYYFNNAEFGAEQDQRMLTVIYNKNHTVKEYVNASSGEKDAKPSR